MSQDRLRASQVIMTYGPGSMVDLPTNSVLISGLEGWKYDSGTIRSHQIDEPRLIAKLREKLGVTNLTLRRPPTAKDEAQQALGRPSNQFRPNITAWEFPEWFLVQHKKSVTGPSGAKARRLVRRDALIHGKFKDDHGDKCSVVPIRFVRACEAGHLDDIDWRVFVHGAQSSCYRDLYLEERGVSGDLDEVWAVCACKLAKQISAAAKREDRSLGACSGNRPWLGASARERCTRQARLLIRSASNAYFAQTLAVISIPDSREAVDKAVASLWDNFLSLVDAETDLVKERRRPDVARELGPFTDSQVFGAITRRKTGATGTLPPIKHVEFDALNDSKDEVGSDVPNGDFFARTLDPAALVNVWMNGINRIVLVHRLREVAAQVGFTRFEAAGTDIDGELASGVTAAPLALAPDWLPATENRGEGIFLVFNNEAINTWLGRDEVKARGKILAGGFDAWKTEHNESKRAYFGLPYTMIHSFSHLLMTAISLECGYPASSIRERVYATEGRYGLLIYTGSSDAEGTLGGLVEAGRRIHQHVRRALELGTLCSNDPVCAHHHPGDHDHQPLLGAACHGCLLIAETSCEQQNDFLDRALVVPTVESPGCEFFGSPG